MKRKSQRRLVMCAALLSLALLPLLLVQPDYVAAEWVGEKYFQPGNDTAEDSSDFPPDLGLGARVRGGDLTGDGKPDVIMVANGTEGLDVFEVKRNLMEPDDFGFDLLEGDDQLEGEIQDWNHWQMGGAFDVVFLDLLPVPGENGRAFGNDIDDHVFVAVADFKGTNVTMHKQDRLYFIDTSGETTRFVEVVYPDVLPEEELDCIGDCDYCKCRWINLQWTCPEEWPDGCRPCDDCHNCQTVIATDKLSDGNLYLIQAGGVYSIKTNPADDFHLNNGQDGLRILKYVPEGQSPNVVVKFVDDTGNKIPNGTLPSIMTDVDLIDMQDDENIDGLVVSVYYDEILTSSGYKSPQFFLFENGVFSNETTDYFPDLDQKMKTWGAEVGDLNGDGDADFLYLLHARTRVGLSPEAYSNYDPTVYLLANDPE